MSALLSQIPHWNDLPLVKLLDQSYAEALKRVYSYVEPLLGSRPLGAEEFTDHNLKHSTRIVQRIGQTLPQKGKELNQPELYILLLSALLHDAGMWTTREEASELRSDQEFKKYCSRHFKGKFDEVERELSSTGREWLGRLGLQLLAASYNRGKHAERLGTFVFNESKNSPSPTGQTLRILVGIDFVEAVVTVSVAHSWDRKKVLEDDSLRPREFGGNGDLVDLRFLAILLRLGDLLDLGEGRISSLMWNYLRPLNPVSEAHWRKESKLKVDRCQADLIEISGHFDMDSGGIKEREAYRLATDWLKWLEDEIQFVHHYEHLMEPQFSQRLQLGALHFDKSRVTAKGLADEGQVSFELDRQRIIQLLGDEIYSDGYVFVRELLQNAVDATRAQMVRDHKQQIENHDPLFPPDNPWHWPHEVTERYTITVNTGKEIIAEKEYLTFSIADPGIGMSLKQISNYFLQVGISYYKTDEFREEFIFPSISNFGIGFLSCLMVADKIEVITRTHDEPKGLRLSIQSPSDHFLVETVEDSTDATPGTQVTLWIDPDKKRAENWDSMPIFYSPMGYSNIVDAIGLSKSISQQFDEAVKQWGLFLEFPLLINGKIFGPRWPTSISLTPTSPFHNSYVLKTEIQTIPITIISSSQERIADGQFAFHTINSTGVPIYTIEPSLVNDIISINSARGIYFFHDYYPDHHENLLAVLNFNRLPRRVFTAGRKSRFDFSVKNNITDKIAELFIDKVIEKLKSRSEESAVIWRLTLKFPAWKITPLLLPFRTNTGFKWVSLEEAENMHQRIVLVPFGVAWHGAWKLEIPCLGILHSYDEEYRWDELFSEDDLKDCPLIEIEEICTGYLWPENACTDGLPLIKEKMTFLINGPVALTETSHNKQQDRVKIDISLLKTNEMPIYDRNGNPWEKLGLHDIFFKGNHANDIEKAAQEILLNIPPLSFKNTDFEIVLDDTEDWE